MPHVLIVDDDSETLAWLTQLTKQEGFTTATADSIRTARIQLTRGAPDILLADLLLPDGHGIELVADLESKEATELVLMTGHASMESAIDALRAGATDYLVKPVDVDRLRSILRRVPRPEQLREEIGELRQELRELGRFGQILGNSLPMQKLFDQIGRVAPTSATVLLVGESGTGKELAAQTIHELSRRKRAPFLPLNCGAVSPQLIESELFGHEKGSFTGADRQHKGFFECAHGGTLFLDEVTEMPPELQVKLLRVLESGTFTRVGMNSPIATDVRVIAATNRAPERAMAEGKLRADLYHRLNVFPVQLPPLRERGTDIELLAHRFLEQLNKEENASKTFTPAAIAALYAHNWPGNVRELRNYVQRAFILADNVIDVALAPETFVQANPASILTVRVGTTLEDASRRLIEATLADCGNVRRRAAETLGISLKTLYNRLVVYHGRKTPLQDDDDQNYLNLPGSTSRRYLPAREPHLIRLPLSVGETLSRVEISRTGTFHLLASRAGCCGVRRTVGHVGCAALGRLPAPCRRSDQLLGDSAMVNTPTSVMDSASRASELKEQGEQGIERVSGGAHEAVDRVASVAKTAANRMGEINEQWADAKDEWIDTTRGYVREHPLAALGIAVSVGYLLSRLSRH